MSGQFLWQKESSGQMINGGRGAIMIKKAFVYGTLRKGMWNRCLIASQIISSQPAIVKGTLYDLPYGYPALGPGGDKVIGEILELADIQEALAILDSLEGYTAPQHQENLYERRKLPVAQNDGRITTAYVYLWARPDELPAIGQRVPSGDWVKFIRGQR